MKNVNFTGLDRKRPLNEKKRKNSLALNHVEKNLIFFHVIHFFLRGSFFSTTLLFFNMSVNKRNTRKRNACDNDPDRTVAMLDNQLKFKSSPHKKRLSTKNKDEMLAWTSFQIKTGQKIGEEISSIVSSYLNEVTQLDPCCFTFLIKDTRLPTLYNQDPHPQSCYKDYINPELDTNTCAALFLGVFPVYVVLKTKNLEIWIPDAETIRSNGLFWAEFLTCDVNAFQKFKPNWESCYKFSRKDLQNEFIPNIIAQICVIILALQSQDGSSSIDLDTVMPADLKQQEIIRKNIIVGMTLLVKSAHAKFLGLTSDSFQHSASVTGQDQESFREANIKLIKKLKERLVSANYNAPTSIAANPFPAALPVNPSFPSSLVSNDLMSSPEDRPPTCDISFFSPLPSSLINYDLMSPPLSVSPARDILSSFDDCSENLSILPTLPFFED